MERFRDFASETSLEGEKMKIADVLGKEITVLAYQTGESRYKRGDSSSYLKLQFELDGRKRVLFTGSVVLLRQCETYREHMPFTATVEKVGKYYTFK